MNKRALIIIGQGRERSLCHQLASNAQQHLEHEQFEVRCHDLLADGFDPCLRLAQDQKHAIAASPDGDPLLYQYQQDVRWAKYLLILHPVWWFAPPAILKGWVDRVLVDGIAVEQSTDGPPRGLLSGTTALVVQTFNAPRSIDRMVMAGISKSFWTRAVAAPTGISPCRRLPFYGVAEWNAADFTRAHQKIKTELKRWS